ncbi:MAG: endonuclease/exonuclease/phosphatase family protein [Kiritimatiellae bacterium]|nr:endonuclease/exonuclease/phosphatase family protein [Kiritimatiellia bacterium]
MRPPLIASPPPRLAARTLAACLLAACLLAACLAACGPGGRRASVPAAPKTSGAEFSVMSYNVYAYGLEDRDGDGQRNDPKPRAEREAVIRLIAANNPDVLALEEMGTPVAFEEFRHALKTEGLEYDHIEYLERGGAEKYLVVLSRFPFAAQQSHTDDVYSIGEAQIPVARGFIDVDIQVNPSYRFRLMVAHLKSKVFHSLGQTEMRRNEARLLGKHVRNALRADPDLNLLVVGDMNDTPNSATLREIAGKGEPLLLDLRPRDAAGAVWTHYGGADDQYARIDYMLASRGMIAEAVPDKTRIVSDPLTYTASDHRPLVAVFRASDLPSN